MLVREKRSVWADVIPLLLRHREFLGRWGVWLALAGFLILETLAHAFAPVVEHLPDPLWSWLGWHPAPGIGEAFAAFVLPAALFLGAVKALGWYIRRDRAAPGEAPPAGRIYRHRGLIASLSPFNAFSRDPEINRQAKEEIRAATVEAAGSGPNHRNHVLRLLYGTNWGPVAGAIELHGRRLGHVWLFCTPAVDEDFPLAKQWIDFLTERRASVEAVRLKDQNSVAEMRLRVHALYEDQVKRAGLRENQVVADMTSGTAAMTAGLILATLDEQRHVEYLSQGPASLLEHGEPRTDLSSLFQYVATSPGDVARALVSFLQRKAGLEEET